jgi:hypothetical protein
LASNEGASDGQEPLEMGWGLVSCDFKIENSFLKKIINNKRNFQEGKGNRGGKEGEWEGTGTSIYITGKQVREGGTPSGSLRGCTSQAGAVQPCWDRLGGNSWIGT